jgi:hypothetical protein
MQLRRRPPAPDHEPLADQEPDDPTMPVRTWSVTARVPVEEPTMWDRLRTLSWPNLGVAFLVALVAGGGAAFAVNEVEPVYFARTILAIDNPQEIGISVDGSPITKLNLLRFKYASLAGTAVIVDPVASTLSVSAKEVYDDSTVTPSLEALLMTSEARANDPNLAKNMSIEVAKRIVSYTAAEHESNGVPPESRFTFRIVDLPTGAEKIRPTPELVALGGVATGIFVLLAVYVLLQLTTRSRPLGGEDESDPLGGAAAVDERWNGAGEES